MRCLGLPVAQASALPGRAGVVKVEREGSHTQRLVEACWMLGGAKHWVGLRRWAHMLGFGGHFLTKSRYYSVTFRVLRQARAVWQRTLTAGPEQTVPTDAPTVLVVNFLNFVGAGWHTTGDALLAHTAAVESPRPTTGGFGRADHRLGELTAQPSSQPRMHSQLDNSTVDKDALGLSIFRYPMKGDDMKEQIDYLSRFAAMADPDTPWRVI